MPYSMVREDDKPVREYGAYPRTQTFMPLQHYKTKQPTATSKDYKYRKRELRKNNHAIKPNVLAESLTPIVAGVKDSLMAVLRQAIASFHTGSGVEPSDNVGLCRHRQSLSISGW